MLEFSKDGIPADKYAENALRTNGDFLVELSLTEDLHTLKQVVHDWAYFDEASNESLVFEVVFAGGQMKTRIHKEDEVIDTINVFIEDPIKDITQVEQEVRNFIGHTQIADAVIRIIIEGLNEKKA